jgi:signal recognition particle subunit SRP54
MASRILGMGDVLSIVEKAQALISEEDAMKFGEKVRSATFDFNDFLQQSQVVGSMGSLGKVAKMMPGIGGISTEKLIDAEKRLKRSEAIIKCMTAEERATPDLFTRDRSAGKRIQRLAEESGLSQGDVKAFLSEFQKMRGMMSRMMKASDQMTGLAAADEGEMAMQGNRATRRASSKKKKGGRGGGAGFG